MLQMLIPNLEDRAWILPPICTQVQVHAGAAPTLFLLVPAAAWQTAITAADTPMRQELTVPLGQCCWLPPRGQAYALFGSELSQDP